MGQYQQKYMDLKGCTLELAQRNSQISVPFAVSSLGYGMLWNNPAVGQVTFGKNYTEWTARSTKDMDYWLTAADTPKEILENYTAVTGRAPKFPEDRMGLWQCKLRYRTQEEVLEVARRYQKEGIKIDQIVIDFFHWTVQGDWKFDEKYWPDPKAMVDELHSMGIKVIVSVWPSVDRKSENFWPMLDRGLLIKTERGALQTYDFQGTAWKSMCSTRKPENTSGKSARKTIMILESMPSGWTTQNRISAFTISIITAISTDLLFPAAISIRSCTAVSSMTA